MRLTRAVELLTAERHRYAQSEINQRAALDAAAAAFAYHLAHGKHSAECMRIALKVAFDIAGAAGSDRATA